MPDTPQQIGQYHIVKEVGRGGMGVVYLAQDSRLGRSVAIKSLPVEVSLDFERLARFEREARTLAQLDHPNLAGIHGVEVCEDQRYLVLEYVEGETLSEILERGPLPIDEALKLCAQIASGVASAHDGGVIHRDLKPDNIKITPEGKAKVLDFGLAKSTEPTSSTTNSEMPTLTTPRADLQSQTMPGAILGTAPYMSPEQARGRRVDRRSDVWSFGCILYECLTGARLFAGETATDSMGAILHKEIDFGLLPRETPIRVRELLARMLERDKERRLRDLGDAMLELEAAQSEIGTESTIAGASSEGGPGWAVALVMVIFAALIAGAAAWSLRPNVEAIDANSEVAASRPQFMMSKLTDGAGVEGWPSLSPDGSTMVYYADAGGQTDIYSRRVDGLNATNLTADYSSNDYCPVLSPDGRSIAFCSDRDGGGIFVMGATGESPRRLTNTGFNPSWSPNGEKLVYATEMITDPFGRLTISALWTVDVRTGEAEMIFTGDAVQPSWSPSGERIAYWNVQSSGQRDLYTIAADGSDPVRVTNDPPTDWCPVWSPDGQWLYFSSDRGGSLSIWRIAIDDRSGVTNGVPEQITTSFSSGASGLFFSGDGNRLAFVSGSINTSILRLDLDPETGLAIGEPRSITPFNSTMTAPSISPDGESVAYFNGGERQEDLFVMASDGSKRRQITNDPAKDRGPKWTGDGNRLVFYTDQGGKYKVWSIRTDGGGPQLLAEVEGSLNSPIISPNERLLAAASNTGKAFLFRNEPGKEQSIETLPPHPDGLEQTYPNDWSADSSKMLVVWGSALARSSITLFDVESGAHQIVEIEEDISIDGARFSSDGASIFLIFDQSIVRFNLETGESTLVYTLAQNGMTIRSFDNATDDSWFAITVGELEADIWMIEFQEQ